MRESNYRRYDETFKRDALGILERSDRTMSQVARDLGVDYATLRYWYNADVAKKKKLKKGRGAASPPPPAKPVETLEEENARLKAELAAERKKTADLEMDRAILKKAAAFFAKESE